MNPFFDLVACVGPKDVGKFLVFLPFIRKNINPKRIFVIAHRSLQKDLDREDTHFIDEDTLIPEITYERIKEWITAANPDAVRRTGWYLQQFLKMGACNIPSLNDYYLIWDSDLAPFRPLTFFDEDGKVLLSPGTHQHPAYFTTLRNLFPLMPQTPLSYVSEHLMVKTSVMKELIDKMRAESGDIWVRNCFHSIRREDLSGSGFSEYETYGHFLAANYPDSFRVRQLKYWRTAASFQREPKKWFLIACGFRFDIGAFERWAPSISDKLKDGIRKWL